MQESPSFQKLMSYFHQVHTKKKEMPGKYEYKHMHTQYTPEITMFFFSELHSFPLTQYTNPKGTNNFCQHVSFHPCTTYYLRLQIRPYQKMGLAVPIYLSNRHAR